MMVHEMAPLAGPASNDETAAAAWIARFAVPVQGAQTGPLAGLRFAIKDNIDAAGVPTTAACPAFERFPAEHAHVVQRLLDAGATLVGKTNLDQFACGLNGTRSPYGAVPNAFDARYVSGGSSSGSAYVVAAGQVDFALGTDTAGSGRVPAGLNNIVGLKPTKGLLSTRGVLPAAQSVDCVSVFAPTVALALQVLHVARGFDAADPYARPLRLLGAPLPARFLFGVPAALEFFGDQLAAAAFNDAIARLEALGGERVAIDYAPLAEAAALLYDSALVAERYAAVRPFFDAHEADVIEPVRSILASGRNYDAADFVDAQIRLREIAQRVAPMWQHIDLLLVPTAPTHCTIEAMLADPVARNRELGAYTNFVNLLDYAALSVPSSIRPDGLPFGITLIGPCGSDLQLAELGQRYHHATGLTLGATGQPMPPPVAMPMTSDTVKVAVVGAHLSGMPLNGQLRERGARLVAETQTAPQYRLYALPGTVPPKPGMVRVAPGTGGAIAVEVWEMPVAHYGSFVALIPAPLGIGSLTLADGSSVQGFLCEALALEGAEDITQHGGWRRFISLRSVP
ncbi:allophanate hydrolase [Variovorax fucosicus]|uniref:allophanate hydrolase n=1 Tax=Variovorax fucosicus TaxID=3053517 RepID=UPI004037BFCB